MKRQNNEFLQLVHSAGGDGEIHWGREAMLNGLRSATEPDALCTLRLKVCVPTVHGPSVYSAFGRLAGDFGLATRITLLAGSGVLYLYARNAEDSISRRFSQGIKEIASNHNGHISLIKVPRELMSTWGAWIDPTLLHQVFEPVKEILDPEGVFPPLP